MGEMNDEEIRLFLAGHHIVRGPHDYKWIPRYLNDARHFAQYSRDPSSKIGAVAIGRYGQVLSRGWNDFPRRVGNSPERYLDRDLKLKLVVHAEQNCVYNACLNGVSLDGADLYVDGLPTCSDCAKAVIQTGVKRVIMRHPRELRNPEYWENEFNLSKMMFEESGVKWCRYVEESLSRRDEPGRQNDDGLKVEPNSPPFREVEQGVKPGPVLLCEYGSGKRSSDSQERSVGDAFEHFQTLQRLITDTH